MVEPQAQVLGTGLPFASSFNDLWINISVVLSKAEVASSKMRIGGFFKNNLAIESLCF